jgi:hypothetical protein
MAAKLKGRSNNIYSLLSRKKKREIFNQRIENPIMNQYSI